MGTAGAREIRMLKNVLMFLHDDRCHGSLNCFTDIYAAQFRKRGVNVNYISLTDEPEEISRKLSELIGSTGIDAAISLNACGEQDFTSGNSNLWDDIGVPFFNYIVDHPIEHGVDLNSKCDDYHVICLDQCHAEFIKKYYPKIKSVHALPLTGVGDISIPADDRASFDAREYDVMITMGLIDPEETREKMKLLPEEIRQIMLDWADWMEEHLDSSPETALREMLDHKFGKGSINDDVYFLICGMGGLAVQYIRVWVRQRIVEKLIASGLCFHLCGGGWEKLMDRYPGNHVILHGDIPMTQTDRLYRNTKLAINVLPMFKKGTHDRIATAQINGAAVLTDGNDFLRSLYKSGEIEYYDLSKPETVADKIQRLLNDPEALYGIATKGQVIARENLSADEAGEKLIKIIESVTG